MENNTMENNNDAQNAHHGNNKMMLLLGGAVLVAVVVALIVVLALGGSDDDSENNNAESTAPNGSTTTEFVVTQEALDDEIDRLRSNYTPEWTYLSPESSVSEDGRVYYTFVSPAPSQDTTLNLRVNNNTAMSVLFDKGELLFMVDSFNADNLDEIDGLAALSTAFGLDSSEADTIRAELDNLVDQFATDGEQKTSQSIIKNTQFTLVIAAPEEGEAAIGIIELLAQ